MLLLATLVSPAMAEGLTARERQVVEKARAQAAEFVSELEKMVLMDSPTENLAGVKATGDYFALQLARVGFQTRWITLPPELRRAGHLCGVRKGTQGRRLLLIGHLDTVLPTNGFRYESKRAYGSGVNDMKGGNLILLAALRALHGVGALENTQLIVFLTGDEEAPADDLNATRRDLIETAKQSDCALVFEGAYKDTVTIARRGITFWTLEVQGVTGHSAGIFSAASGSGAVFEAARILNEFHEELRQEDGLTINPAVIVGGTEAELADARGSASGKPNVIARQVLVRGDLRFLNAAQLARGKETMLAIAARNRPRSSATLHFEDRYPAMAPTPESAALLSQLDRASQDLGYGAIEACDPKIRGAGDVSFVAPFVPGIDGLGPRGNGAHSRDEDIDLASIPELIERTALLIYRLTR